MNLVKMCVASATAAFLATSASAATTTPDGLLVEGFNIRGAGGTFDVASADLGTIAAQSAFGIAGGIQNGKDTFTFTAATSFDVLFVDLADLSGIDIDAAAGFDPDFLQGDEPTSALFTLDGTDFAQNVFSSPTAPDFLMFSDLAAGEYTFTIDGSIARGGSTYDILIRTTAVPLPAAGLMLVGALGALGVMRRKQKPAQA